MDRKAPKRFSAREVLEGPQKRRIHVATRAFTNFRNELLYFQNFLSRRLLPTEPEEAAMQQILLYLQNLLEYETEELIRKRAKGSKEAAKLLKRIDTGYVTFKEKCDWLRKNALISDAEYDVMDAVRDLRNKTTHARPSAERERLLYRKFPLLTQRSIRQLFVDVELILRKLRTASGRKEKWMIVPPGYAEELKWPKELVAALNDG